MSERIQFIVQPTSIDFLSDQLNTVNKKAPLIMNETYPDRSDRYDWLENSSVCAKIVDRDFKLQYMKPCDPTVIRP